MELEGDSTGLEYLQRSVIAKVRDWEMLESIEDTLYAEGIEEVNVKFTRGLEVVLNFKSKVLAQDVVNNVKHRLRKWFEKVSTWSSDFILNRRLCWIKIVGLPLDGWTEGNSRKVAAKWGNPLAFENCNFFEAMKLDAAKVLNSTEIMETIENS